MKLKYKVVPKGAADGMNPINLAFLDKNDVNAAGFTYKQACDLVAADIQCGTVNILDMDAITVTSDGIVTDGAIVAFASADQGKINKNLGFMHVSEIPYTEILVEEELHMPQWNSDFYRGRRLYRGPSNEDRAPLSSHNENQTMTGKITNNNTASEMYNVVDMTEVLAFIIAQGEIMRDGNVIVGLSGPVVSVGIGMIVRERRGRIFGWNYGPGKTAHKSGIYAKTVKSECATIAPDKKVMAEYVLRALDMGMIPATHLGSSPANLMLAKAYGKPIGLDNIEPDAWIELESVGITRKMLETPSKPMSRQEVIDHADEIIPGMEDAKKYKASEIYEIRYVEA